MNHWSFGVSASVLLVALALWIGAGWLCWANWQRNGRRRVVAWLEGLRFLLITLLAFTLLRPEWVSQIHRTDRPEVAILLDGSASMNTRDLIVSNKVVTRATWIEQQRTNGFWNPLEKSARVAVEDFATPATRTNAIAPSAASNTDPEEGTDLNHALESVLQRQRNLQALLLLSDGDWNLGKSPLSAATRFRDQGVPIFSVTVGREMPLPDLSLEPVTP
ncbi:MAG: vWA domain-containing protein, partial [Verrucomicrobiota bacterium]